MRPRNGRDARLLAGRMRAPVDPSGRTRTDAAAWRDADVALGAYALPKRTVIV